MRSIRFVVLAIAFAVFAIALPASAEDKVFDLSVEGSPYLGAKDAPITIIEFLDYQ